jgi:hypothetical protein
LWNYWPLNLENLDHFLFVLTFRNFFIDWRAIYNMIRFKNEHYLNNLENVQNTCHLL